MTSQLHNTDCFDFMCPPPESLAGKVDCIITDPPYDIKNPNGGGIIKKRDYMGELQSAKIHNGYDIATFGNLAFGLFPQGVFNAYFFCNKKQIPEYLEFYVAKNACKFTVLCWHKTNAIPVYNAHYLVDTEYCLFFQKGKTYLEFQTYDDAKTYFVSPVNQSDKKKYNHPTIKPLGIFETLVRNSCPENGIVFDPFAGTGTTGVACKLNNRNFVGCEINPEYYQTAKQRIDETQSVLMSMQQPSFL